jgi:hypothetical protein
MIAGLLSYARPSTAMIVVAVGASAVQVGTHHRATSGGE